MYQDRILLTVNDILEKEFKVDTRGYRPQEVDKFLDVVIRDYQEMVTIIKELQEEKRNLTNDNIRLKQEIRNLQTKLELVKQHGSDTNNSDLLKRLSNLENIIYGRE